MTRNSFKNAFCFRFHRQNRTCPKCLRLTTFTTCTPSRRLATESTRRSRILRCLFSPVRITSLHPRPIKCQSTLCPLNLSTQDTRPIRCGTRARAAIFPGTIRRTRNILTKIDHPIITISLIINNHGQLKIFAVFLEV